ncbi:MAG: hypothetical protein PHS52_00640 [Desulfotomaculaceae bacterium]|nr:hypothetical protein [Desulfotomaculaceae bacterium]
MLEDLQSKLVSSGFQPEDVEYCMLEILQYKKPESLNSFDFTILSDILHKRRNKISAQKVPQKWKRFCLPFGH